MITSQVRDILVPLADFPHITRDASLREAFAILQAKRQTAGWHFRNLLVFDADETLVGLIGILDLLRALMPDYLKATMALHYAGALPDDASLSIIWQESFAAQCEHMASISVENYMVPVLDTVQADDPLTRAAYLMISHRVNVLPVLEGERILGVVRIVDVFNQAAAEVLHD